VATTIVVAVVVGLLIAAVVAIALRRRALGPVIVVETPPEVSLPPPVSGAQRPAPLPVVLVHGLFGFDRIARFDYFRGIARHLASLGCTAHAVRLPPASSVPVRAQALCSAIELLQHERVDVIAHSMGGLDARYALARLGLARRVRALVTIGTPHRGSPIADMASVRAVAWSRRLLATIGLPLDALEWLTTAGCARFNAEILDVPGVRYACVVGGVRTPGVPVALPLLPAHAYLRRVAGANDGLVPMSSQVWGETLAEIEADHFAQVGWLFGVRAPRYARPELRTDVAFDAAGLYAFIVARLGDVPSFSQSVAADRPLERTLSSSTG
jgi:triacylglycerol lipase